MTPNDDIGYRVYLKLRRRSLRNRLWGIPREVADLIAMQVWPNEREAA